MLGNKSDARFIRDWYIKRVEESEGDFWDIYDAPDGWGRLGRGCSRAAFLSPEGVVYKVQHHRNSFQSNKGEAETLRKHMLTRLPKGCRLPRWTLYEVDGEGVMVMEKFDKLLDHVARYSADGERYHNALPALRRALGLADLYGTNLAVDEKEGKVVPIDLAA